jgi:hypothetical protein
MKAFYLILIVFLPLHSFSQTLLGTTGGTLSDTQNHFDFSIGEPIVADVSAAGFTVNVGFQQPFYDSFTSVLKSETAGYQIFPNPFSNAFRFEANSEIESYFLLDASGREVFQSQTTGTDFEYKVSNLPKGFYQLRVHLANGKTINSKVIHHQ